MFSRVCTVLSYHFNCFYVSVSISMFVIEAPGCPVCSDPIALLPAYTGIYPSDYKPQPGSGV
jgi:hypothetical protein